MKNIILFLISFVILTKNKSQTIVKLTDWESKELKSSPKKNVIKIYVQKEKFGDKYFDENIEATEEYNSNGMLNKLHFERIGNESYYNSNNYPSEILNETNEYEYFENSNCLSSAKIYFKQSGRHPYEYKYNYECQNGYNVGKNIRTIIQGDGQEVPLGCAEQYEYDENKDNIKATSCGITWISKYNSKHKVIQETKYDEDGYIKNKWFYKYDSKGNIIQSIEIDGKDSIDYNAKTIKIFNSYDIHNNLIRHQKIEYESDPINKKLRFGHYNNEKADSYSSYVNEYYQNGNLKKSTEYWNFRHEPKKIWESTEYKYDNNNNWVEKIITTFNNPPKNPDRVEMFTREIEYYQVSNTFNKNDNEINPKDNNIQFSNKQKVGDNSGENINNGKGINKSAQDTKEIRTFTGHNQDILSVCFSPDGKYALSGSIDNHLKLWDISNGICIRTLLGHLSYVESVSFSPDNKYVLSASVDKTLKLWDISTGECIRTFNGDENHSYFCQVCFSPNGKYALSVNIDDDLKLWDINTGECIRTFNGKFRCVCFSPDGKYALAGGFHVPLTLLDINTGESIKSFYTFENENSFSICFSPDGKFAFSGSGNSLREWDVTNGNCIKTITGEEFNSINISPDGKYALSCNFNSIKLWNIATSKCIKSYDGHESEVRSVCFSPDGKFILSGSVDKTLKLWEIK